jgi:hypothetical protein
MLTPDLEKYRKHVTGIDLPQSQKDEVISIVFKVMQTFVDRAFGVNPAQQNLLPPPENASENGGGHVSLGTQPDTKNQSFPAVKIGGPR